MYTHSPLELRYRGVYCCGLHSVSDTWFGHVKFWVYQKSSIYWYTTQTGTLHRLLNYIFNHWNCDRVLHHINYFPCGSSLMLVFHGVCRRRLVTSVLEPLYGADRTANYPFSVWTDCGSSTSAVIVVSLRRWLVEHHYTLFLTHYCWLPRVRC